jgi:hypothetical protein
MFLKPFVYFLFFVIFGEHPQLDPHPSVFFLNVFLNIPYKYQIAKPNKNAMHKYWI